MENKIYLVVMDCSMDGCPEEAKVSAFSRYEKAKAFFDECVAEEKAEDHLMESDDLQMVDEEAEFSIWEDGEYCEDHYTIRIIEMTIDKDLPKY